MSGHATKFLAAKDAALAAGAPLDPATLPANAQFGGAETATLLQVFVVSGIVFALVGGLCALLLSNPPSGYAPAGTSASTSANHRDFSPQETLAMPQLYALWLILFLNVTAGILIISNAVPILQDLTKAGPATAAAVYGGVAIFNGLGRFFWGAISDRIGRNLAFTLIFGTQVLIFFALPQLHDLSLAAGAFAIVLLCYGGGFGTMPSFTADYFGTKFLGYNYGMIITAWGFGGIVGPIIASRTKDLTGSFTNALVPVAIMLLIAAIIPFFVKPPAATLASRLAI
ncbi:MAG: MFS transporter [Vulcanimicrobiaceae bacterium]